MVRSPGIVSNLDPDVAAQIGVNPFVERVIPFAPRFHMLDVRIPPFIVGEASPYAVYQEDMNYLIELYGLKLKEGHLPRPDSNEIVISESLAQNRNLQVGETIGNPDHPCL